MDLLQVSFIGEDGSDNGGLSREFLPCCLEAYPRDTWSQQECFITMPLLFRYASVTVILHHGITVALSRSFIGGRDNLCTF